MKSEIINQIIEVEGGYVNDPQDSGGETNFGITKATARRHGYMGQMIDLPRATAFKIYQTTYWDSIGGDKLAPVSEDVTREVFDTCVNVGPKTAAKFLQRALNAFNYEDRNWPHLEVDGIAGSKTALALELCLDRTPVERVLTVLNCLQGHYYVTLTEQRGSDKKFFNGWINKRVVL